MEQPCQIPKLKISDPSIDRFFHPYGSIQCDDDKNWIYTKNGIMYIDESAIKKHGEIECNYENIYRINDFETSSNLTKNFPSGKKVLGDFFSVQCRASDRSTYSNVHATVKPLAKVIERSKSAAVDKNALNLNVYIFGFDSISRLTFQRKLPKTFNYITSKLGAIVLEGYNIIGDGTPQALIPILTGKTEIELPSTRKTDQNADFVNVYPFLWKDFENSGYATLFGEDEPHLGCFTFRLKGFNETPTDHYMRTFYLAAHSQKWFNKQFCWGSQPHHKVHFQYAEDFFKNYPSGVRKFAFMFHGAYSHDDINAVEVADEDTMEHFEFFEKSDHLNNTIIIIMADHGHRFAKFRETQQGKLEERLPFLGFIFPPWFETKFPSAIKNLRLNTQRLTTPFDIYPTLKEILNFEYPPKAASVESRGISLFREIPQARSCRDAEVDMHWCTCLQWINVPADDALIRNIAQILVDKINNATERDRKLCAKLTLKKIELALIYKPNKKLLDFHGSKDKHGQIPDFDGKTNSKVEYFQLNIRTTPGDALYETTLIWNLKTNSTNINLNDVSHINRYGDLPHCVIERDYSLAKWCVCYDKIDSKIA